MNFANTLKNLRELHNVTQDELAKYLKVSRPTIAGYERKNRQPDFEKLVKIAEYFNVSIDYLITGIPTPENAPVDENALDHEIIISYKKLSVHSKQDLLKYIKLLELYDQKNQQD